MNKGFCGASENITLALANLHYSEEPIISGTNGSGTIFFSGCNLKCVFCQNSELSTNKKGKEITINRLAEIFKELEESGAHNINLVTPSHYANQIMQVLDIYRPNIPIVYNTNGYESIDTIKKLSKYIDIYLTDFKYYDNDLSNRLSHANNYKDVALSALREMIHNQPENIIENGIMKKGVIVRHLVLPNHTDDSIKVLDLLHENFGNKLTISLMSQYVPLNDLSIHPDINRTLKPIEYKIVLSHLEKLGFDGYMQELSSNSTSYIPNFDYTGVDKKD
jgi:putative pyruvate formate lyase activating enzyme